MIILPNDIINHILSYRGKHPLAILMEEYYNRFRFSIILYFEPYYQIVVISYGGHQIITSFVPIN
jgi:hypothetical protein